MFNKIFSWFENRLNPYPKSNPTTPEKGLFRFIWSSIDGMKGWIFLLAVLTVGTGVMEALLFQFMGLLVDWLGAYSPTTLWQEKGHLLAGMAALLIFSIVWSFV
ncbi:MAG: multidrug ABC transporter ATP-binding protein, partial [Haemophilus parainfluenzae]|nr:multidrug ABC transporter ATP-binding protein [Haemophilus parainfluenzae]